MSISKHSITRVRTRQEEQVEDSLIIEEPLELRIQYTDSLKGRSHKTLAITMRTPGQDKELALGFLFSEGVLTDYNQVKSVDQVNPNVVKVSLQDSAAIDLKNLERHFYITSSCGVCGKASLEALSTAGAEALHDNNFALSQQQLLALGRQLEQKQSLFKQTGGNHAVALFNSEGEISLMREDVGRHNAMDKLIGTELRKGALPLSEKGVLLSGRASFELLQKALMAGCPMVISVGAPSSLAVELAEEFNITLIGFLSENGYNIYNQPENR